MNRILLAAGQKPISSVTLDFACFLAQLSKSAITGVFLEPGVPPVEGDADVHALAGSFRESCISRNVVPGDYPEAFLDWEGLIAESRFADCLIIDEDFTLQTKLLEANPSHDARRLLHGSGCPVLLGPLSFEGLDELIFTYDGSRSSLHAMRQFAYLFPELRDLKLTILEVQSEEQEQMDPEDEGRLKRWLSAHFNEAEYVVLEGAVQESLLEYLLSRPHALVVMGGFGRSRFSRLLHPSASGAVVRLLSSPVFLTHL